MDLTRVKFQKGAPPTFCIRFGPNSFSMFPVTVLAKVTYLIFFFFFFLQKRLKLNIVGNGKMKGTYILEMAHCGTKPGECCDPGGLLDHTCIWGNFDLVVFKVIWGAFGAVVIFSENTIFTTVTVLLLHFFLRQTFYSCSL